MDRMPTFEIEAPTPSLEIQEVQDLSQSRPPEKVVPILERETPFLPPRQTPTAKAVRNEKIKEVKRNEKGMTPAQEAHLERMRERKAELKALKEQGIKPPPAPKKSTKKEKVVVEEPAPVKERMPEQNHQGGSKFDDAEDFNKFLSHYEKFKTIKHKMKQEDLRKEEALEREKEKEIRKEEALEARIRAKILAEQSHSQPRQVPRRWTPSTKQPIPATQHHLATPVTDFGVYSNRYF